MWNEKEQLQSVLEVSGDTLNVENKQIYSKPIVKSLGLLSKVVRGASGDEVDGRQGVGVEV